MIIDYHDTGTKVQREYQPIFVQHPIPSQKIMTCAGENDYLIWYKKKQKQCVPAVPAESEKEPAPGMYVAAVPAESQKESEILQNQVLNMRKHRIKHETDDNCKN